MYADRDKINNPTLLLNPPSASLSLRAMASLVQSSQSLGPSSSLRGNYKHAHQPISSSSSLSFRWINSSRRRRIVAMAASSKGKYLREDYLVKKVTAKEVEEMVKGERSVPLILDFYATWCGPCILMAQELETLAVEYGNNALFVKVDTDDEYEFARDMQVRGLPTLYFISPDPTKDAIRTEGLIPSEMIKSIIDNDM